MANNLEPYYLLQTAFTGGEISPEVANRVDLDKYQFALLKADNCLIRPYGPVYKRTGMVYCNATKYADKKCMLVEFAFTDKINYLLEIGEGYIRVYREGKYLNVEMITPYKAEDLPLLRFAQSADVMFIASGKYPVKTVSRYDETDWRFGDYEITDMYFDVNSAPSTFSGTSYETAGSYQYTVPVDGEYQIEVAGAGGGGGSSWWVFNFQAYGKNGGNGELKTVTKHFSKSDNINITVGAGGAGGTGEDEDYSGKDGEQTTVNDIVCKGGKGATKEAAGESFGNGGKGGAGGVPDGFAIEPGKKGQDGWARISYLGNTTITPSDLTGEITLTANKNIFTEKSVGAYIQINNKMPSKTVSASSGTTEVVTVGESWKIITHGTWTGTVTVEKNNNGTWEEYRKYTSKNDFNANESGTVDSLIDLRATITGGANVDLTALPYTNEGIVKITEYVSPTEVKAKVIEKLGNTEPADDFYWGAWSEENGYPRTVCFFQDRLCFGGTAKQPYMLWMSRSGDYPNFSVEKASGTVTDDSAIAAAFVSRKQFSIKHLIPSTDLLVFSEGNEWIVSGSDVVSPTNITPKMQTTHGTNDCEPQMIGGRIIYVQGRGSIVRDMGYSFETDSYGGMDLTLLAKHLIRNVEITDTTYQQNPDSILYFVLSNGTIAALSYIREQEVYAWSTITTEGSIEAVASIGEGDVDAVYVVVKRTINGETIRYIERLANLIESNIPDDYVMLDSAYIEEAEEAKDTFFVEHLKNMNVNGIGDGRKFDNITVDENGNVKLPAKVNHVVIGLPYTMEIELPNVEIKNSDGTIQGRFKQVSNCILRLQNSLGGYVGPDFNLMDRVQYDEFSTVKDIRLYSGDKEMTVPIGGFKLEGRVCIKNSDPYPFNLLAIIREVSFGG